MKKDSGKCIVLMYHRIEEPDTDPWNICVSPEHFEEQIAFLNHHFPVISTSDLLHQISNGGITENSVCITFDDGYADNVTHAIPVLEKQDCLATFFIATSFTGSSYPYWWDELEMICLHAKELPSVLHLSINNEPYTFCFETDLTDAKWQQHRTWRWYEPTPTQRCDSFLKLWNLLRPMGLLNITGAMEYIRQWSGTNLRQRLPADEKQLQALVQSKVATIGLHTHTHMDLQGKHEPEQMDDILKGKKELAECYSINASLLAYPYGRFDEQTINVVNQLGLKAAFTTEASPVTSHSKHHQLGRFGVGNWNKDEFAKQLDEWFR